MKKLLYIIILMICIIIISCGNHQTDIRLVKADTLIARGELDSAMLLLNDIGDMKKYSDEEIAYYNLLKTIVLFKSYTPPASYDMIDQSITYYTQAKNWEKLSCALIYKGQIQSEKRDFKRATFNLKRAEEILSAHHHTDLKIRNYSALSFINNETKNHQTALDYAKKALQVAQESHDKRWLAYCYLQIYIAFYNLNQEDSAYHALRVAYQYHNYAPKEEQAMILGNMGGFYWKHKNYKDAEKYLKISIETFEEPFAYGLLASVYTDQQKNKEAAQLWEKAFLTTNVERKTSLMWSYAQWLRQRGRSNEAWNLLLRIPIIKDSLNRVRQTEAIKETQDSYDKQLAKLRFEKNLAYSILILILITVVCIAIWLFYHICMVKARKDLAENQLLVEQYTQQLEVLQKAGKSQTRKMADYRRKLQAANDVIAKKLYQGKQRYEEILNGGNTAIWRKADFNDFMEYYRTVNLPFVVHLEEDYHSLTPMNKVLLSLYELDFDDKDITQIMNMTEGALRTAKSRIKDKMLFN